jgi:hypothetical protein
MTHKDRVVSWMPAGATPSIETAGKQPTYSFGSLRMPTHTTTVQNHVANVSFRSSEGQGPGAAGRVGT